MKVLFLFITAILLLDPFYFFAQPESFNVFYVKGTAILFEKNKKDTLLKGMRIYSGNKLITHENAVVVLFNKKGLPAVIDKQGTYSYIQICTIFNQQAGNSLIYDYFNYLVNEFLDSKVERTQAATVVRGDSISMIFPPDSAWSYDNKIEFKWKGKASGQYFVIRSEHNDILELYTTNSSLVLYPYSSGLKKGTWYRWIVSDNVNPGGNSMYNNFYIPDESSVKDLKKKELQVSSYLPEQKSEEYYTCLIALYLQYHDYKNAYEQVREAKGHKLNSPSMEKLYFTVDKLYGLK